MATPDKKDDIPWPVEPESKTISTNFNEAKESLLGGDTDGYLARLIGTVEVDYKPIEKILGQFTRLVQKNFAQSDDKDTERKILVIPRGSFATRTAVKGHVDLDIDVILPADYQMGALGSLKDALGEDKASGNILFDKEGLKRVLTSFYNTLITGTRMDDVPLTPTAWLKLPSAKPLDKITRSLSLETTQVGEFPSIPIDVFIKVRTTVRRQDVIIGIDKDSLAGQRRYQTTSFIPQEGKWIGDRTLSAVDRVALLSLKWWKNDLHSDTKVKFPVRGDMVPKPVSQEMLYFNGTKVEIKSHHLLTALNALHELDPTDKLYVSTNSSESFSLYRVKDVMWKILEYLNRAYHPEAKGVMWTLEGRSLDYFVPEEAYQTMERLFMQIRVDWPKFCYLLESNVIASFYQEIYIRREDMYRPGKDAAPAKPVPATTVPTKSK